MLENALFHSIILREWSFLWARRLYSYYVLVALYFMWFHCIPCSKGALSSPRTNIVLCSADRRCWCFLSAFGTSFTIFHRFNTSISCYMEVFHTILCGVGGISKGILGQECVFHADMPYIVKAFLLNSIAFTGISYVLVGAIYQVQRVDSLRLNEGLVLCTIIFTLW